MSEFDLGYHLGFVVGVIVAGVSATWFPFPSWGTIGVLPWGTIVVLLGTYGGILLIIRAFGWGRKP